MNGGGDQRDPLRPAAATGLAPPRIRPSNVRALVGLTLGLVLRLLREGLVVRALVWPGLLTALSMFASASITIAWRSSPLIYVSESELVAPLKQEGFRVRVDPNPESVLTSGGAERAVWRDNGHLVLGSTWGGQLTHKAEAVLRDLTGERWRIEIPEPARRQRDSKELQPVTGLLAGVVGLLFTLYGVVIGAGSLYRDRSSGVLESDLALPVPTWMHAAARILALGAVLGPALVVSLFIVDALLAIHEVGLWMLDGFIAALMGGALGVVLMARAASTRGFSGPLSQGLTLSMAMISLGFALPSWGRMIPLVSLGSAFRSEHSSWAVLPIALLIAIAVVADFERRECL